MMKVFIRQFEEKYLPVLQIKGTPCSTVCFVFYPYPLNNRISLWKEGQRTIKEQTSNSFPHVSGHLYPATTPLATSFIIGAMQKLK